MTLWEFPHLVVSKLVLCKSLRGNALLRSFAPCCVLLRSCVCVLLRSCVCVLFQVARTLSRVDHANCPPSFLSTFKSLTKQKEFKQSVCTSCFEFCDPGSHLQERPRAWAAKCPKECFWSAACPNEYFGAWRPKALQKHFFKHFPAQAPSHSWNGDRDRNLSWVFWDG